MTLIVLMSAGAVQKRPAETSGTWGENFQNISPRKQRAWAEANRS